MILATETDRPAIEVFLRARVESSMFPLSNLARFGMAGGHPRAMSFWVRWLAGEISDVLAVSDEGMLFPQCPTGPWGDVSAVLAGSCVKGVLGHASQVAALKTTLRLPVAGLDTVEPLFELALPDLIVPDQGALRLARLETAPLDLLIAWREAYCVESLAMLGGEAAEQAKRDIAAYIAAGNHRVLLDGDTSVAMAGFNAVYDDVVQIGGVYTPPELRSQGYARLAVALHLQEARAAGSTKAILFAANAPAERAYRAIGFRQIGHYMIAVYSEPQVIHV